MRIGRLPCATGLLLLSTVLAGCTSTATGWQAQPGRRRRIGHPDGATRRPAIGVDAGPGAEFDGAMMNTFAACLGRPQSSEDRLMATGSPAFSDASGNGVHSSAVSYRSADVVDQVAALFRDRRATACFTRAVSVELEGTSPPPGASVGTPQVVLTPGSNGGPSNVVASAALSFPVVTVAGAALTIYTDFVVLRGRTTTALLGLGGAGAPLPPAVRDPVVQALARRIAPL